jgi:signal recognition particle receptor subunit alpha
MSRSIKHFYNLSLASLQICFWLIENDLRVLVAACDTFRAGAVEQLRTHAKHLNALHPAKGGKACVELYEKGYGKDAAGVAAEAISHAKDNRHDVVLVDTAGRMQDNEPLMRALAKVSFHHSNHNCVLISYAIYAIFKQK